MSRRRWIYPSNGGEPVEITNDSTFRLATMNTDSVLWNDRNYQDAGDPRFSSREQHREYMRQNNLSMACDYTNEWEKAKQDRVEFQRTGRDPSRLQDVIEAFHNPRTGTRPRDIIPKE